MATIDYIIIGAFMALLVWIVISTNKLTKSVAGFLSSERCAGRYLLTLAQAMAFISAASFVGGWQGYYNNGLGGFWWMLSGIPVSVGLAMSGWVMYRYRSTRALTMPQFLEMRYSRKFRIMAGFMAFLAGILNCGFFPAVTSGFLIKFIGLPETFHFIGLTWDTYTAMLVLMVGTPLMLALAGGQISIMVTDFFQGMITNIAVLSITFYLLNKFNPDIVLTTLIDHAEDGKSLINPFSQGDIKDFGPMYFFMLIFVRIFTHGVWQGNSGYMSSAKTAHEGRMATMLGEWRNCVSWSFMIVPVIIWAILHNPQFAETAASINEGLSNFVTDQDRSMYVVPLGLKAILPAGLIGLLVIMMFGAGVSTDDSCYHSWGSIFLQDAIMPLRKKPFTPKQHLLALRLSITGIGLFAFLFSKYFKMGEYLPMWTQITSAIFIGGAGCAVVGGLYWKKATTQGAWVALIIGSTLSFGTIVIKKFWEVWATVEQFIITNSDMTGNSEVVRLIQEGKKVPVNQALETYNNLGGAEMKQWILNSSHSLNEMLYYKDLPNGLVITCWTIILSLLAYVVVSLLTCKKDCNMDKLLHRGKYKVEQDHSVVEMQTEEVSWLERKLGITKEFSKLDKIVYIAQYVWIWFWGLVFVLGSIYCVARDKAGNPVSEEAWAGWWKFHVGVFIFMALVVTVWYGIGGTKNIFELYRILSQKEVDVSDDGMVKDEEKE